MSDGLDAVDLPPGRYRHFKGGLYDVIGVARLEADRDQCVVVYRSVADGTMWVRPFESFTSTVDVAGEPVPRFAPVP